MKTLILNGSPRKNGDTASLISIVSAALHGEVKLLNAYDCSIQPCVDCRYCITNSGCSIKDGMQEVYDFIVECDNILIASPIYFSQLTGALLNVASRLQTFYCARKFRGEKPIEKTKKGAVILVGGGDGTMERAYHTARILLRQMNASSILPAVCFHDTNNRPAAEDADTVRAVHGIACFFNQL